MRDELWWDQHFLGLARDISLASKDPSTKTGAIFVRPDKTIASTGYNGFPRKIKDHAHLLENRPEKYKRIIHCEMNALIFARERLDGYTLYTYPFLSCERCAVHMIQAGIVRAVAPALPDDLKERWGDSLALTKELFEEAGIKVAEIAYYVG